MSHVPEPTIPKGILTWHFICGLCLLVVLDLFLSVGWKRDSDSWAVLFKTSVARTSVVPLSPYLSWTHVFIKSNENEWLKKWSCNWILQQCQIVKKKILNAYSQFLYLPLWGLVTVCRWASSIPAVLGGEWRQGTWCHSKSNSSWWVIKLRCCLA